MHGPYEVRGRPWWLADGVQLADARDAIGRTLDALESGRLANHKSGRRKGLFHVRLAGPGGSEADEPFDHLLKRNGYRGVAAWRRRWSGSKARQELARAERLAARGLPTPIPMAAGEERAGGRLRGCWLLVPRLEGAVDLRTLWEAGGLAPTERRALATALGQLARRATDAGLFQDDFAPNNVLIRRGVPPELVMIDFERAEILERVPPPKLWRSLAKLDREMVGASRSDRLRFLTAFAGEERRTAWAALAAEAPRLLARDLEHLARTLRRPGRRFVPVRDGDGWSGLARRDLELETLIAEREEPHPAGPVRTMPPLDEAEARRVFATAILLARRGLGPAPRALWRHATGARLQFEGPRGEPAPPASRRALLRRLTGLAEITGPPEPAAIVQLGQPEGRAGFVQPDRVVIRGKACEPATARAWIDLAG